MDESARAAAVAQLVHDSGAREGSIEIFRERQTRGWATLLANWTEERTGQNRRGAVDIVLEEGRWRARGGWNASPDQDTAGPIWRVWGSSRGSMSGWVSDPACAVIRLRNPDGHIESDVVEGGAAILIYDGGIHRDAVVESLDNGGNVLRSETLAHA
ncbi:MAG: hypothetical protein U0R78_14220 [Nocardioidaceae bacterium]